MAVLNAAVIYKPFHTSFLTSIPPHHSWKNPRSSQVMSPGQLTWPYPQQIRDCAVTTVLRRSMCNFQGLLMTLVPSKHVYQNFDLGDLRLDHFLWTDRYRVRGKCSSALYSKSTSGSMIIISRFSIIRILSMKHTHFWTDDLSLESLGVGVLWGQNSFLPLFLP